MNLTVITCSIFSVLLHNASWCKIQWNNQNACLPFAVCTLSWNFVAMPAFLPTIDGASLVARLTARDQSITTLSSAPVRELKMSSAAVVSLIGTNSSNSL